MITSQLLSQQPVTFAPELMDCLDPPAAPASVPWLWQGFVARGNVTLLTSQWKAGKTTLVTGLLRQMGAGGSFLDHPVVPGKVLVVTEESRDLWADRLRWMPVGPHYRLLARPFLYRPTPEQWDQLIGSTIELRTAGDLDLLVIDSLARFLPGRTESDLETLHRMLDPLRYLTRAGAGVTILHHIRRRSSVEGTNARGHAGLRTMVEINIELRKYGSQHPEERRRKLFAVSPHPETPRHLVYEWAASGQFVSLGDPVLARFQENWGLLRSLLAGRQFAATHKDLLAAWPANAPRPSAVTLYEWLNRAAERKLVRRAGSGRRTDPYRYRLANELDESDE
jgi:hypothetical protein